MKILILFSLLFGLFMVMPPGAQAKQADKAVTAQFAPEKQVIEQAITVEAVNYQFEKIDTEYTPLLTIVADLPQKPERFKPYGYYIDVSSQAQNCNLVSYNQRITNKPGNDKTSVYKERVRSDTRA
jgi:hypothetical protein